MKKGVLEHDWFDRPLPANVEIGERSWLYSSYAFLHYQSELTCGVCIGHESGLYHNTFFDLGPQGEVKIGNYCAIVGGIFSTNGSVVIGDYALVAHEVVFADHAFAEPALHGRTRPRIEIDENVWIGARAMVIGEVQIGEGSIVGAFARVADVEIPPYTIFAGNPARQVGVVPRRG